MAQYLVLKDGQNFGPYSIEEIRARLRNGELTPDDLVWTEGMEEWQPIRFLFVDNHVPTPELMVLPPEKYLEHRPKASPTFFQVLGLMIQKRKQQPASAEPARQSAAFSNQEKPHSVHVNVVQEGCTSGCGKGCSSIIVVFFVVFLLLGLLSLLLHEKTPEIEDLPIPNGNIALINNEKATGVRKNEQLGKVLNFRGKIQDVAADNKVEVKIDSGNYVTVTFAEGSNEILNLKKEQIIEFTAKVESFGTGILVYHRLSNGSLTKVEQKS